MVNVSSSMGWFGHLTTETEFTAPGDKVCRIECKESIDKRERTNLGRSKAFFGRIAAS